ncbi:MAG TPA: 50S ribosomal protein L23 [Candidatus Saccharimonadales bacterium]|nr:50S ribosomal protein L23 [Candidatus Saccharimonadales bacterium]
MKSIIRPVLSEKTAQIVNDRVYVFSITAAANKKTVAAELKALYDVTPTDVRIVNLPAKKVNFKRHAGERSIRRKAYVQLPPKQQIPGFEVLKEAEKKQAEEAKKASDEAKKVEEKA